MNLLLLYSSSSSAISSSLSPSSSSSSSFKSQTPTRECNVWFSTTAAIPREPDTNKRGDEPDEDEDNTRTLAGKARPVTTPVSHRSTAVT
eukprot:scaffold13558_cov177-Amphora_coffeaeformis.AAC.6